jgi:hypothetical protein
MSSRPKNITLVLGAGASHAMGYPVGSGLRRKILDLCIVERQFFSIQAGLYHEDGLLPRFIESFGRSQMLSIDAFLARRPEFSEIGKRSIAALLLEVEDEQRLLNIEHQDHWYRYFFNKFAAENWEHLDFSNISIATFNYDRSLEKFLHESIKESYGKSDAEAAAKLDTLKIIHIYGSLGSPIPGRINYLPYGGEATGQKVKIAADSLRVIPEGRDDDEALEIARKMLSDADRIAFMGFGFDETNIARLRAEQTCRRRQKQPDSGYNNRQIVATCMGFTSAESMKAFRLIGQELDNYHIPSTDPPGFYSRNCLDMLRETLILD